MSENDERLIDESGLTTDDNRHPPLIDVLDAIKEEIGDEIYQVERVDIYCFASGEASYRVWPVGAEDPELGAMRFGPELGT